MTEFWIYMNNHWWVGFWLCIWFMALNVVIAQTFLNAANKAVMVLFRGWPPNHLNASGNWKPQPELKVVEEKEDGKDSI